MAAWLGKVNFGDFAGAVTKLSESVKNIERNFDSALGFDEKDKDHNDGQSSGTDRSSILNPVFAFVTQRDASKDTVIPAVQETKAVVVSKKSDAVETQSYTGESNSTIESDYVSVAQNNVPKGPNVEEKEVEVEERKTNSMDSESNAAEVGNDTNMQSTDEAPMQSGVSEALPSEDTVVTNEDKTLEQTANLDQETPKSNNNLQEAASKSLVTRNDEDEEKVDIPTPEKCDDTKVEAQETLENIDPDRQEVVELNHCDSQPLPEDKASTEVSSDPSVSVNDSDVVNANISDETTSSQVEEDQETVRKESSADIVVLPNVQASHFVVKDENTEVDFLKQQIKMLEHALQGAAHQSKVKADELSRLSLENDSLRSSLEEIKRSGDAELEVLKEEFQQRINASERKVYALTKERDMLRREQSRKDSSILLKEKDEIIKQVMAEGEELSRKQAAQEAQMRKLRAQIRELEEEKQRLKSKLQVEEATVESIRRDKAATEKALQEAVERAQVELAIQKEFYTNALNEAKEAEARAEARADTEARQELERKLREADEREAAIVQNLEELRQTLSRTEQQAAFREDMLRRDVEDLEQRCQAAERRYEELVASVPESTRPLLRQIDAMRETMAARAEAWSGVERSLNSRLQEAEAKAAAAQERERAMNERLTQTLSRMAVLEAQVSCLKAELSQITRTLEKERQRASESRQEYLAAAEAAATHEGHAKQIELDLKELRSRFKRELAEERTMRELLQKELEQEKQKTTKRESALGNGSWPIPEKQNTLRGQFSLDSSPSRDLRRLSSASTGNLEESYFLQVSLDSNSEQTVIQRRNSNSGLSHQAGKFVYSNASVEQLESLLSQKEGELALYMSRLASLESTRNALAEELVKATTQCEKLRAEVASVPGLCAELESLRRRHTSALELMGERDEQVEELKADLADVKQMYREQIDMLVNQIEQLSIAVGRNA